MKYNKYLKMTCQMFDYETVKKIVSKNGDQFRFIPNELKYNREIVLMTVNQYGNALLDIPNHFKYDREILLSALNQNGNSFLYIPEHLKHDRELCIASLNNYGTLYYLPQYLRNDRELALIAIKKNGYELNCVSDNLKNDEEIVSIAVNNLGDALQFASDILKNNKKLVISAVSNDGKALRYTTNTLQNDKDVVSVAVSNNGLALYSASDDLKNDKQIVLMAINDNPEALYYASDGLKNDREIIYTAISKYGNMIAHASDKLKNNKELVLLALSNCRPDYYSGYITFEDVPETLKNDIDVVLAAVKNDGFALYYVSYKFQMEHMIVIVYAIYTSGIKVLSCALYDNCLIEKTFDGYYNEDYYDNLREQLEYNDDHIRNHTYHNIYIHIKENIKTHESFLIFLYGVCVPRTQTVLQKHGYFHSIDFLKLIAKFTGFINVNDYRVYKSVFRQISLLLC